jgi:tRNA uridine 5-carboxymethylaminomethyl modification enzyme
VSEQVQIAAKYEGYIVRQLEEIEQMRRYEDTLLPKELDYSKVGGLSNEIVQKLSTMQPETLGSASRIQGVTPAALSQLLIYLKKHHSVQKQSA